MQSSPSEYSTHFSTHETPTDLTNPSNYGFHPPHLHSGELASSRGSSSGGSSPSIGSAGWQSPLDGGVEESLRRLNIETNGEHHPRPSYQRIAEYESALSPTPPRKHSEGPAFKVVRKKGGKVDEGPQLENFPNGTLYHSYPTI
jgi:hypothetical protein